MPDNTRQRRLAAQRASDRILSGAAPVTMRERLADMAALAGPDELPDFYDGGPTATLEGRVAELLGTEAAVFFSTGTMAQQVALRHGAERTGRRAVALHPLGHQELFERKAYAQLTGLRSVWPTTEPRNPTAEEITAIDEPVGTVVVELPLRDAGFVLPGWDELVAVSAATREIGAFLHLDGARIWESVPYLGHSLSEIAGLADSTYVSFYKTLGGISGAALTGTTELVSYARAWRHRYGGGVFQQWPAALTALAGLERELPRVPDYVRHARTVGAALATLPGARVFPEPPHTHRFRLWLPHAARALNDAALAMAEEEKVWFAAGWRDGGAGHRDDRGHRRGARARLERRGRRRGRRALPRPRRPTLIGRPGLIGGTGPRRRMVRRGPARSCGGPAPEIDGGRLVGRTASGGRRRAGGIENRRPGGYGPVPWGRTAPAPRRQREPDDAGCRQETDGGNHPPASLRRHDPHRPSSNRTRGQDGAPGLDHMVLRFRYCEYPWSMMT